MLQTCSKQNVGGKHLGICALLKCWRRHTAIWSSIPHKYHYMCLSTHFFPTLYLLLMFMLHLVCVAPCRPSENCVLSCVASGFILHLLNSYFAHPFQTHIALGCLVVGSESDLLLNTNAIKNKWLNIYVYQKKIFWFVPSGNTPCLLMQHIHCLYQAHICFIHCHFGSFTINEEIWHLMRVDLGYLILLSPRAYLLAVSDYLPSSLHLCVCWLMLPGTESFKCPSPQGNSRALHFVKSILGDALRNK